MPAAPTGPVFTPIQTTSLGTIRVVGGGADVIAGIDRVEKDSRDRTRNCATVL
jgi:hypothetical protein